MPCFLQINPSRNPPRKREVVRGTPVRVQEVQPVDQPLAQQQKREADL